MFEKILKIFKTENKSIQKSEDEVSLYKSPYYSKSQISPYNPDCYDEKTEILTNKGWKYFKDLNKTELVATLNPKTLQIEYKKPSYYIEEFYEGEMYKIENKSIDFLVTPNHKFFVINRKSKRKCFKTIKELSKLKCPDWRIPKIGLWKGEKPKEIEIGNKIFNTELFVAFLGIYLAEGSVLSERYGIFISQKNIEKREKIKELLNKMNLKFSEQKEGFAVHQWDLWGFCYPLGKSWEKYIPYPFKQLSFEYLQILLDWFLMGDGTIHKGQRIYYTSSKRLADDLQEILLKIGRNGKLQEKKIYNENYSIIDGRMIIGKRPLYEVIEKTSKYNYFHQPNKKQSYIKKVQYKGKIYCVEVENHIVCVRRNGKVSFSGNSLVQKKGSLNIYQKMKTDDQIKAVLTMKKHAVLSSGWDIKGEDEDMVEFLREVFEEDVCIEDKLYDILSALDYGFSVSEIIYKKREDGRIGLKDLKTRPPHSFEFRTDKYGNINKLIQYGDEGEIDLPLDKFIIYSYNAEFGNPYGNSDLRAVYRAWFSKDITIKFRNIFNERFGMPTVVAKYPSGLSKKQKDDLDDIIKNIQAMTGIKIPEGIDLSFLESAIRRGASDYESAIKYFDTAIARGILCPNLLGFTDINAGSYALGEKQFDVFIWILEKLRRDLESRVKILIKKLVDYNFGNNKEYPKFVFNPLTQENKENLIEIFIKAVEKGVIVPTEKDEEYIRESLNLPVSQEKMRERIEIKSRKYSEKKEYKRRKPNEYEKKVNFVEIEKFLDEEERKLVIKAGSIIQKAGVDLIDRIFREKIIEEKKIRDIEDLSLKYMNEFRALWKNELPRIYNTGKKHGISEIKGKSYKSEEVTVGNLPPKLALEYFERQSFRITGTEKEKILREVKNILYQGLKTGKTNAEIKFQLEEFFSQYTVYQKISTGEVKPIEEIPGRLTVVVRTNLSDAYNQGRLAGFQDPDVRDIVAAYEYSAILDQRTTPFCESYDGKIFKANDPIWSSINPPNHFSCRSTIVPILNDEKFEIDKPLAIKPAKGFG